MPRRSVKALLAVALGPWLLVSCGRHAPPAEPPAGALSLRTTDGALAANNLEAEITQAERQHGERPGDVGRARALVDRLLVRAQFFGRLVDYDRAEAIASDAVTRAPKSGEARLLRARIHAALHQFSAALADADAADALSGARDPVREQTQRVRVGVWEATGAVDRALVYLTAWRRDRPDLSTYAAEAAARADERDVPRADALFEDAKRHFGDVSPFSLAWVEFQQGHLWESAGRLDKAQPLYEEAHARLPGYAPAAAHLAIATSIFGDPAELQRAEAMLRTVVSRSDDPEYVGQLAVVERQLGHDDEADRLTLAAAGAYERLLRRHPEAFFDHAARFFFHVGRDPRRALALAEKNLALRPTVEARELRDEVQRGVSVEAVAR